MIRNFLLVLLIGGLAGCDLVTAESLDMADPGARLLPPLVGRFLEASQPPAAGTQFAEFDVPTVGCPQDGQVGPREKPPLPGTVHLRLPAAAGPRLAYYSTSESPGTGVLGPRGWDCFGVYGSDGSQLYVVPQKMSGEILGRPRRIKDGPAIVRGISFGETSGRFAVAHVAARLFPKARKFVDAVRDEGIDARENYKFVPWTDDRIKYLADFVVSFTTPAGREGAGTASALTPGQQPISGLIIAHGIGDDADQTSDANSPYLSTLTVRLSPRDVDLYAAIAIARLEAEQVNSKFEASSGDDSAIDVVTKFYAALSRGDGGMAASLVIPEKRETGPLSARALTQFYSRLTEPLKLLSVRRAGESGVFASYRYRSASGGPCDGEAEVTTTRRGSDLLIERIRASKC
jgi:hypothetical protein